MNGIDVYGFDRVLEPKNTTLQQAWRIDNTPIIHDNEILIDVMMLNINSVSFNQIYRECHGVEERIIHRINQIVSDRGKLHNPVTSSGGMLYGRVAAIGKKYINTKGLKVGDEVISLVSLTSTPLVINKVLKIDAKLAQVYIEGKCILFSSSLIEKRVKELPVNILIAIWDAAGPPSESSRIINKQDNVVIIDPGNVEGILCSYAAHKTLNRTGKLTALINRSRNKKIFEGLGIFDEIIDIDVNSLKSYERILKLQPELYDVVISCLDSSCAEMLSVIITKDKGTVFFPRLCSDNKIAGLSAEAISKDISIVPYKGYVSGHADYALELVKEYPQLQRMIEKIAAVRLGETINELIDDRKKELIVDDSLSQSSFSFEKIVCNSPKVKKVLYSAIKVASYDCTVLITGESGTGKEVIAKTIYSNSKRSSFPFIKLNCSAIPENLLESELFGYEKGAFTGANSSGKIGFWEQANGGVLFLDEVGELSLTLQAKLLRVLQENEFFRLGGINPVIADARIITATNRDLSIMVKEGRFREDLYYRLSVFPLCCPPLRERKEDIPELIYLFTKEYNEKFSLKKSISKEVVNRFMEYYWPGNIRELQNIIQRLLIQSYNNEITLKDLETINIFNKEYTNKKELKKHKTHEIASGESLKDYMSRVERDLLIGYRDKYRTSRKIADALNTPQTTISRKLRQYNIDFL